MNESTKVRIFLVIPFLLHYTPRFWYYFNHKQNVWIIKNHDLIHSTCIDKYLHCEVK